MNGFSSMDSYHLFVLLLICHLLSDYYFQSQEMADKKDNNIRVLAFHILLVGLPLFVLTISFTSLAFAVASVHPYQHQQQQLLLIRINLIHSQHFVMPNA